MKKISFLLLILLSTTIFGQDSKVLIGVELTPTLATLRYENIYDDYNARLGFSAGLTFDYIVTKQISVKTGLAFERKGAKSDIILLDGSGDPAGTSILYLNYDYLTLPILASFSTNGKIKVYGEAGPFFGFLLKQKYHYDSGDHDFDNTENTEKLDIGLSLGIGVIIPMSDNLLLGLGLSENLGLTNTLKDSPIDDASVKTNTVGFMIRLKYRL